ncbi:hypothetical protein LY76DRAFT_512079 [Colletotrichum caudatum]|nr:hypothetical protein LY76DRAFT_512079 [Colletotrichum caudatum]
MTWTDGNRSRAEIGRTLSQLLSNLNAGLESDRAGKWYRTAFECTQAQLLERFQCLLKTTPSFSGQPGAARKVGVPAADSIADDPPTTSATATAASESLRLAQRFAENHDSEETCGGFPPRESTLFGSTDVDTADGLLDGDDGSFHRVKSNSATGARPDDASSITRSSYSKTLDEFLLRRVLDVSRDLFGAFVPRDGSFVTHAVCKRFWGSVDTILRSYGRAEDALDHWHNNHTDTPCPKPVKRGRPFDDPCVVLLRREGGTGTPTARPDRIQHEIVAGAEAFCGEAEAILDQTEGLHKLVASVTASDDPIDAYSRRPHLPSSLVTAFEGILGLFVLKAKELSWMNRFAAESGSLYSGDAERRLDRLKEAGGLTSRRVREHLIRAKEDIIMLGTTKGDSERIIIAPVGPEFLAACLISSLQNSVPAPGAGGKLDLVAHYRNRTSRLWFDASRKPKRGAFVAIHALEEELEALRVVVASQQHLLRSYQRLLSPLSFGPRTTDRLYYKERKASFNLENKCIRGQQRRLAERDKALSILQRKARTLRDETKQRIEILDEGHGKAIRVFTIVTLFFLPL